MEALKYWTLFSFPNIVCIEKKNLEPRSAYLIQGREKKNEENLHWLSYLIKIFWLTIFDNFFAQIFLGLLNHAVIFKIVPWIPEDNLYFWEPNIS